MDWKELLDQGSAGSAPLFFQLATVTLDGGPANRTVTFRGLDEGAILFTTDADSDKVDHLRRDGRAEVCWYRTESRDQFRITALIFIRDVQRDDLVISRALFELLADALAVMSFHRKDHIR